MVGARGFEPPTPSLPVMQNRLLADTQQASLVLSCSCKRGISRISTCVGASLHVPSNLMQKFPKVSQKTTLTDRFLRAMKAADGRIEFGDAGCRGLSIRCTPAGVKTWTFAYK